MDEKVVPDRIAEFILAKIESVAELEGLLLLKEEPGKSWTAPALADRLYLNETITEELLRVLCAKGLAVAGAGNPPDYVYRPESSELADRVGELADFYSKHIVPVTNLIHSRSRLRVQGFADAFKLRKDN